MPSFLPSANIYQRTRAGRHTNISQQKITIYFTFPSHRKHILKIPTAKGKYEAFSRALGVNIGKYETIHSYKAPK